MKDKTVIKIAIVDDSALLREALASFITKEPKFEVVLQAGNGKILIDKLRESKIIPDICLLDIAMPVMNGFETLLVLQKEWPQIKVLVMTMFNHEFSIIDMIKNGANGYYYKGSSGIEELHRILFKIYHSGIYYPNFSPENIVQILQRKGKSPLELTGKEKEFLKWCCSDLTYEEIARKMNVSPRTVENYRNALLHKLNVKHRAGLIVQAWQTGLIIPTP